MRDLKDLEKVFERGLKAWEEEIVVNQANKMGLKIVKECKKITPFQTNTMRRCWFCKIDKKNKQIYIWVSNSMEYAPYVNNGHRIVRAGKTVGFVKGKHCLEKGIENYKIHYLKDDVNEMLEKLSKAMK